jgi:hypothetical protein
MQHQEQEQEDAPANLREKSCQMPGVVVVLVVVVVQVILPVKIRATDKETILKIVVPTLK